MASQFSQQYACKLFSTLDLPIYLAIELSDTLTDRAQKSLGLVGGTPDYASVRGFVDPVVPARTYQYSNDGRLFAYTLPTVYVSPRVLV